MNDTTILWEEENSIEQSRKSENKPTLDQSDGINETKIEFAKNECESIGNKKRWMKPCPNCGAMKYFNTKYGFKQSVKLNARCSICKSQTKNNYIGSKFGKITITNQYYLPNIRNLKVDYICECGCKTTNKAFGKVKNQTMCRKCSTGHNGFKHGRASFNSLYASYTRNAKRRLLEFKLTENELEKLTQQNCFYCGGSPNCIIRPKTVGAYVYNGIDRKDSNKGYTLENSVPCCKLCNVAKWALSQDDFLNHVKKIYEYQFVENKNRR